MHHPWDPLEGLDGLQRERLDAYAAMLVEFNRRINLISREDEEHIFEHHVTHGLFLSFRRFPAGATVVDWGTGGGLPAIPLAIAFPDVQFVAVDAIHKKIQAVRAMARRLRLENLEARQARAEEVTLQGDYSVSRATAPLREVWEWHLRLMHGPRSEVDPKCWMPGLVCLKGGDLDQEVAELDRGVDVERISLSELDPRPYFAEKVILACTPRA